MVGIDLGSDAVYCDNDGGGDNADLDEMMMRMKKKMHDAYASLYKDRLLCC